VDLELDGGSRAGMAEQDGARGVDGSRGGAGVVDLRWTSDGDVVRVEGVGRRYSKRLLTYSHSHISWDARLIYLSLLKKYQST